MQHISYLGHLQLAINTYFHMYLFDANVFTSKANYIRSEEED